MRERTVNALGRIGRGRYSVIEPYGTGLFRFASDEEPKVRLSFIWAAENIATNHSQNREYFLFVDVAIGSAVSTDSVPAFHR